VAAAAKPMMITEIRAILKTRLRISLPSLRLQDLKTAMNRIVVQEHGSLIQLRLA
jgi:hypothetical protein